MKLVGLENQSRIRIAINQVRTAEGLAFSVEPGGVVYVTEAVANHPAVKRFLSAGLKRISSQDETPPVVLAKVAVKKVEVPITPPPPAVVAPTVEEPIVEAPAVEEPVEEVLPSYEEHEKTTEVLSPPTTYKKRDKKKSHS
jgi:hypothetical protein